MSYIVLARKWRPKRFEDVVGQEHITTTLQNSLRTGRTAHAYLFVGPRGIGKTTTARIFAKAINCPKTGNGEPCGECDACREIDQGRSIDVIEIDGASNNSVEDIRMLRENVKIAPATLKFKVYIIDEVHMLSTAAFNAFLKTLEEPPGHVKFILATTEAQKIPTTVLSRCQRFDFRRLTSRQIFSRLKQIVDSEGINVEDRALFAIARATEGSMRDALSILDQLVSFSEAEISLTDVHAMLGTVGQEVYRQIAVAISENDSSAILQTINEVVERGKDLAQFLKELTLYFRNLLLATFEGSEQLIDLPEDDLASLRELAGRFGQSDLIRMVQEFSELESRFRQLPSTRVAFEMLLMRMSQVGAEISIDSVLSKLAELERKIKPSGKDRPDREGAGRPSASRAEDRIAEAEDQYAVHPDGPEESPEESEEDIEESSEAETSPAEKEGEPQLDLWNQFLGAIREQSMSIFSFVSRGRFGGIEDGQMIVSFDQLGSYNKEYLEQKEVGMLLEETLKAITGSAVKIRLILEDESAAPPLPSDRAVPHEQLSRAEQEKAERLEKIMNNPIVKKTIQLFRGKIVYVSN